MTFLSDPKLLNGSVYSKQTPNMTCELVQAAVPYKVDHFINCAARLKVVTYCILNENSAFTIIHFQNYYQLHFEILFQVGINGICFSNSTTTLVGCAVTSK